MTTQFKSITQYDKNFDSLFENPNLKGFSCSFFSLISAWKFLNGETPDVISHETTIAQSLLAQSTYDMNFGLTFEEMLSSFTNINPNSISATSSELINSEEFGFAQMFQPKSATKTAIIVLKNERYLTTLIDENYYYFRDCHENTQYNFYSLDELVTHLINSYQFIENVNVGGFEYHEYSSIEFITLKSNFDLSPIDMLGITANTENTQLSNNELIEIDSEEFNNANNNDFTDNNNDFADNNNDFTNNNNDFIYEDDGFIDFGV